jgi:hypothetical protein
MTFTAEHYRQRVRRDHLNRGLVQANRHIAEGRLYVAKQTALIDGLDRDGHDSAMARELLAILHKSLQMHEGHREHIIRELELGSASVGRHVTAAVADDIAAGLINVRLGPFGLKSDIF